MIYCMHNNDYSEVTMVWRDGFQVAYLGRQFFIIIVKEYIAKCEDSF
jgi:hypothetical protein